MERTPRRLVLVAAVALAAGAGCGAASDGTACNGHDALCARAYDQVAFPGTHDAYSNVTENFGAPDQTYPMARQLADGVRVLHLEIVAFDGDAYLCHSLCQIGSKLLTDGLAEIRGFVAAHPRDVVTLLMESSGVSNDDVATAFKTSGLDAFVHAQPPGAPWPTLGELVTKGDRVIALLPGGGAPWLLDRFNVTWETPWNNRDAADFVRCDADRGTEGNPLYVVDTYLEDQPIPTAAHAALVNVNPFLVERLLHCQQAARRLPSFVMVNYYEVGDLFDVVDVLNGFAPPSGDVDAFPPAWNDGGSD